MVKFLTCRSKTKKKHVNRETNIEGSRNEKRRKRQKRKETVHKYLVLGEEHRKITKHPEIVGVQMISVALSSLLESSMHNYIDLF